MKNKFKVNNSNFPFKSLISKIDKKGRLLIYFSILLTLLTGIFDFFIPLSIYNLLNLSNTESSSLITSNKLLSFLPSNFYQSFQGAVLFFIFSILIVNSLKMITLRVSTKTAAHIVNILILKVIRKTLNSDYLIIKYFIKTSKLLAITGYAANLMDGCIFPVLNIVVNCLSALIVCVGITITFPKLSFIIIIISIIYYFIIFLFVKKRIANYNLIAKQKNIENYQYTIESIENFAYTKLENINNYYYEILRKNNLELRKIQANAYIIGSIPRNILEIIIGVLAGFILLLFIQNPLLNISIVAFILVGFQRALPAFQITYGQIITIKTSLYMLHEILELDELLTRNKSSSKLSNLNYISKSIIQFSNLVNLNNVYIRSVIDGKKSEKFILKDISFNFNKGEWVNIIGESGAGKTTLLELICGLRFADNGSYLFMDKEIKNQSSALSYLHPNIGFVAQSTSFKDISLKQLVCGFNKFDKDKFEGQLISLGLKKLIDRYINDKEYLYNNKQLINMVSGGEKQRIMLARALYRNPKLLVLDEATSALDQKTQALILEELYNLKNEMSIILVTHRKESLIFGNRLIELSNGKIINSS